MYFFLSVYEFQKILSQMKQNLKNLRDRKAQYLRKQSPREKSLVDPRRVKL